MDTVAENTVQSELAAISYVTKSDIGKRREENQDSYGAVETSGYKCFLVADGMGGVKGGAVASQLAMAVLTEVLRAKEHLKTEDLVAAIGGANTAIFEQGLERPDLAGMGTTIVGLCFLGRDLYVANVGDSRAYRIRGGEIEQMTEDHTLVTELLRSGAITASQVDNHPASHMLTRSLGPTPLVDVGCRLEKDGPVANDKYLLCTDGLYNLVSRGDMLQLITENPPAAAAEKLVDLANQRGGTDNITLILISVGPDFPGASQDLAFETLVENDGAEAEGGGESIGTTLELNDTLELQEQRADQEPAPASTPENVAQREEGSERAPDSKTGDSLSPEIKSSISPGNLASEILAADKRRQPSEPQPDLSAAGAAAEAEDARPLLMHGWGMVLLVMVFSSLSYLVGVYIAKRQHVFEAPSQEGEIRVTQQSAPAPAAVEASSANPEPVQAAPKPQGRDYAAVGDDYLEHTEEDVLVALASGSSAPVKEVQPPQVQQSSAEAVLSGEDMIESYGESLNSAEVAHVKERKTDLRDLLHSLEAQISSFDKPLSGDSAVNLRETAGRIERMKESLAGIKAEIDIAARKLAVWYGRRERLKNTEATKLATQVSATSEAVRQKQQAFQQVTWGYLKEAEVLSYNPNDESQKKKVAELVKLRKQRIDELADEVRRAIDEEVARSDRVIAELTLQRDGLETKLAAEKRDMEYGQALFSPDKAVRERKKNELMERREITMAELEELRQLLPDAQEGKAGE
jgi:PPM family protein phosphatase